MENLKNKVAVITGAAGLLGKEHSKALAQMGTTVYVTDIDEKLCQSAIEEIRSFTANGELHAFVLDVTNEKNISELKEHIAKNHQKLDILINNAAIDPKVGSQGLQNANRLENFGLDSWNFQIEVGLTGAMLCSKHLGHLMAQNGGGVIVNVASDLSVLAPNQTLYQKPGVDELNQDVKPVTYSVIKAGLVGLTRYLATYWAHKGVRANALSPGGVFTDQPEEFVQKLCDLIPQGKMAAKDEYHGCIQFLCSDSSRYINGQNLVADGGRSVW